MPADLNLLMVRLRELGKAHARLSRAIPDPARAIAAADVALQRVLTLLDDPKIAGPLGELMTEARDRLVGPPSDVHVEFKQRRSELIKIETTITRRLGARQEVIERLYRTYESGYQRRHEFPDGIQAMKQRLVAVHEAAKLHMAAARKMSRKDKKQRKRKLGQGITSAIFGTGIIVADSQLPALFVFSYGLGGGALHQALRDIVGEDAE